MSDIFFVNQKQVQFVIEVSPDMFVTDASDIGLPAGQWPKFIDFGKNIGNGYEFMRHSRNKGEELKYVNYVQCMGVVVIRVFND